MVATICNQYDPWAKLGTSARVITIVMYSINAYIINNTTIHSNYYMSKNKGPTSILRSSQGSIQQLAVETWAAFESLPHPYVLLLPHSYYIFISDLYTTFSNRKRAFWGSSQYCLNTFVPPKAHNLNLSLVSVVNWLQFAFVRRNCTVTLCAPQEVLVRQRSYILPPHGNQPS